MLRVLRGAGVQTRQLFSRQTLQGVGAHGWELMAASQTLHLNGSAPTMTTASSQPKEVGSRLLGSDLLRSELDQIYSVCPPAGFLERLRAASRGTVGRPTAGWSAGLCTQMAGEGQ